MSRIIEMYRRVPDGWALMLAATISWVLAAIAGIAGGIAGVYLYDRGNSKGDDLAVLYIGLLAVSTFTFVVLFTWLQTLHHKISSRTPMFAWLFCLAGTLVVTVRLWPSLHGQGPLPLFCIHGLDRDFTLWADGACRFSSLVHP